jgi:hypothetical protein
VNAKRVNAVANVICRSMENGRKTPAGWAMDLESAQLLQSPETAAEMKQLRDDITGACLARWEEEQENARLRLAWQSARRRAQAYGEGILRHVADRDYWKEQCRQAQVRVAELEAERHVTNEALDDAVQELRTPYAERARRETHPGRRQAWLMLARVEESERVANALLTPEVARSADKLTRLLAPTQALREPEGEFHAYLHHAHTTPHDLPETGGAPC